MKSGHLHLKLVILTVNPQYQPACSLQFSPYTPYGTIWENLIPHQGILSLLITSCILMTCVLDQVVLL